MLLGILLTVLIIVCVLLITVILMQRSEGGALGMGGGGGGGFLSTRGTADLLTRTTQILGFVFFVLCLAIVVVMKAFAAIPSAATAEPALKPYQPTHNIPVPMEHNTMLCGGIGSLPWPLRLPRIMQRINADQPEYICTTVPPAKSIYLIAALAFHTPFIAPLMPQIM